MNAPKFKVGDKVRIKRSLAGAYWEREYEILETRESTDGQVEHRLQGMVHCKGWCLEGVMLAVTP